MCECNPPCFALVDKCTPTTTPTTTPLPSILAAHACARHYPDGSKTLLQRRRGLTVGDVVKQALRKRGIRFGEYALEVIGEPQVALDNAEKISDVEAAKPDSRVQFLLIKKFGTPPCNQGEERGGRGGGQAGRQAGRQTDRQDRQTHIHTRTDRQTLCGCLRMCLCIRV